MVAVLDALGAAARVDVYGDSYGSFAAQALVLRHPGRVRSLVLDGTYPLDFDPWARDALAVARSALRATCDRSPTCPWRTADPVERVATLARRLRARPLVVESRDPGGRPVHVRLDDRGLAGVARRGRRRARDLPRPAGGRGGLRRRRPRAARAARRGGLRRAAPTAPRSSTRRGSTPPSSATTTRSSSALAASPVGRLAQLAAGLRALPADAFAPFDRSTWFGADLESYDWCVALAARDPRADPPRPPGAAYPAIPTLVLDGDLDQRTSLIGARRVAAALPRQHARPGREPGPRDGARRLVRLRGRHRPPLHRDPPRDGHRMRGRNPALHLVAAFPRTSRTAPEATPASGDGVVRRAAPPAWCAAQAVADAVARYPLIPGVDRASACAAGASACAAAPTSTTAP